MQPPGVLQVATLNCAKGAVRESSRQFVGTYAGIASSPATREAIEGSDCLLTVGYRRVERTVGFFTDKLPASAIHLNSDSVDTADKNYQGVHIAQLLQSIVSSSSGIVTTNEPARPSKQVALCSLGRSSHGRRILEGDTGFSASRRCDRCGRRSIERRYGPTHTA